MPLKWTGSTQRQRTVNVAPAIVALQKQAEEIRQAELRRIQARLGSLTPEQAAAIEALTRGLVNKFLHPPMQALKQAARENDSARDGSAVRDVVRCRRQDRAAKKNRRRTQSKILDSDSSKGHPRDPNQRGRAPMNLRIGSRGSQLALWQANHIAAPAARPRALG